jgi:hypothetical protein
MTSHKLLTHSRPFFLGITISFPNVSSGTQFKSPLLEHFILLFIRYISLFHHTGGGKVI